MPSETSTMNQWILAKEAPAYFNRPKRTVYRWIEDKKVRTMRPLHETWAFLPDLARADRETPRRRRKPRDTPTKKPT